jgi:bifunctional UDP-N-acetylglucosamine pyrophosphorylase/glucosamine-1-phosphate N-acetyltransferase
MIGIVILAAGNGSRLNSRIPKPLMPLLGTPMIGHIVAKIPHSLPVYIITNPKHTETFSTLFPRATLLSQNAPKGTGHALTENIKALQHLSHVIVLNADTPLIPASIFKTLIQDPRDNILVGFESNSPEAYGQIKLDGQDVVGIVEARDREATNQHSSNYYYSGVMKLSQPYLSALQSTPPSSVTGEYYLTALASKSCPFAFIQQKRDLFDGINTVAELLRLEQNLRALNTEKLLEKGTILADYYSAIISPDSHIGENCQVGSNVTIKNNSRVGNGCIIGQGTLLSNAQIADGVTLLPYSVVSDTQVAKGAAIGPFAHLQGNSQIGEKAVIGNFVEIKRSTICSGVKAKHLSYLGDAYIDHHANIGAGVITCNYVPWKKQKQMTYIGEQAFVGSNCLLIAPVFIGSFSVSAAGSVITESVLPYALALSRAPFHLKVGWAEGKVRVAEE